jgi:hypothetical protein
MIQTNLTKTLVFIKQHPLRDELIAVYLKGTPNTKAKRIVEAFIASLGCGPYEYMFLEDRIRVNLASI